MNKQIPRNVWVTVSLVGAATVPALLAIACSGGSGTDAITVGGPNAAVSPSNSEKPSRLLVQPDDQSSARVVHNGRWIAYATLPWTQGGYGGSGSDVFLTRAGDKPKLLASRGSGGTWNVCPTFSPNGRMLAFLRLSARRSTIVVVRVARDGPIEASRIDLTLSGDRRRCPRWSSDSSRLAYLDGRGRVIVRALDGSTPGWTNGDPKPQDFGGKTSEVSSPTGRLIARLAGSTFANSTIVVSRPDGSRKRLIHDRPPSYAIAGWSPDGRKLLVMRDVGGGFLMRAVSVEAPFVSTTVVAYVKVNGEISWPGYGDVSWQPAP